MKKRRVVLRMAFMTAIGLAVWVWPGMAIAAPADESLGRYEMAIVKLAPLFEKKRPPEFGDWLASREEAGQTFRQYVATNPNRPTAVRRKLYLQPIGPFEEGRGAVNAKLREFMSLFYGLEVEVLPTIPLEKIPMKARRTGSFGGAEQLLTTYILDMVLLPKRPNDAVAVLGITATDLWPGEGWNFVFGQASLKARVGVWSTARFGDPAENAETYLRRTLQVAVHETGHMFGIKHCTAYECGMNGSNSLEESDRAPLYFCAQCDAKLWWACKPDPAKRATGLAEFADKNGFERSAKLWREVAKINP